jgi:hypothetical protein
MVRGKRGKPKLGQLHASFEAVGLRSDLLRFADGELEWKANDGFAILEMMRFALLAISQKRHLLSDVTDWDERIRLAWMNAAIIEVSIIREHQLLDRIRERDAISLEEWLSEKALLAEYHDQMIKEAARAAAGWMDAVEKASKARGRGRPKAGQEKALADKGQLLDWAICMEAGALMAKHPNPNAKSPWKLQAELIPEAVAQAIAEGRLAQTLGDTPQRNIDAHTDRIRRRLAAWLPDPG